MMVSRDQSITRSMMLTMGKRTEQKKNRYTLYNGGLDNGRYRNKQTITCVHSLFYSSKSYRSMETINYDEIRQVNPRQNICSLFMLV